LTGLNLAFHHEAPALPLRRCRQPWDRGKKSDPQYPTPNAKLVRFHLNSRPSRLKIHKADKESISKGEKACATGSLFWKMGVTQKQSVGPTGLGIARTHWTGEIVCRIRQHAKPACDLMQTAHN
jgi:hypothetical protein